MLRSIYSLYFFIWLVILFQSCRPEDPINQTRLTQPGVQVGDITLTVIKNSAPADGAQYNEFLVKVSNAIKNNFSEVVLDIAPDARFSNGSATQKLTLDLNGEARVYAQSSRVGAVTVRATAGNYSSQAAADFSIAYPDQIIVEADSVYLPAETGMKTAVRARLLRASGTVSPGIIVSFTDATGTTPASVGSFRNVTVSSAAGVATAEYWLQNTTFHGDVDVIATVPAANRSGQTKVRIR